MVMYNTDSIYYAATSHDISAAAEALADNANRNVLLSADDRKALRKVARKLADAAAALEEVAPIIEKGDYGELD